MEQESALAGYALDARASDARQLVESAQSKQTRMRAPAWPLIDARGQTTACPKRLILFFTPHATFSPNGRPRGTQTNFTLGPFLGALGQVPGQNQRHAGLGPWTLL